MKNEIANRSNDSLERNEIVKSILLKKDISGLTDEQKIQFISTRCTDLGLDYKSLPFDIIKQKNGRGGYIEFIYANKNCAAQLSGIHGVAIKINEIQIINGDEAMVSVTATAKNGRSEDDISFLSLRDHHGSKLSGVDLSNAKMKAITKAKRRVVLSLFAAPFLDAPETSKDEPGLTMVKDNEPSKYVDSALNKAIKYHKEQLLLSEDVDDLKIAWGLTPNDCKDELKSIKDKMKAKLIHSEPKQIEQVCSPI